MKKLNKVEGIIRMRNLYAEILDFTKSISDLWKDEPLDGDETEAIAEMVKIELDWQNGNITKEELLKIYQEIYNKLKFKKTT